jgi:hypothetical protein
LAPACQPVVVSLVPIQCGQGPQWPEPKRRRHSAVFAVATSHLGLQDIPSPERRRIQANGERDSLLTVGHIADGGIESREETWQLSLRDVETYLRPPGILETLSAVDRCPNRSGRESRGMPPPKSGPQS